MRASLVARGLSGYIYVKKKGEQECVYYNYIWVDTKQQVNACGNRDETPDCRWSTDAVGDYGVYPQRDIDPIVHKSLSGARRLAKAARCCESWIPQ